MACTQVTPVTVVPSLASRTVRATWGYQTDSQRGFRILYEFRDTLSAIIIRSMSFDLGPSALEHVINKTHMGPGQEVRASVTTLCEGCGIAGPFVSAWIPIT